MKDSVIIVSGGMDSITLLYDKKDEIALGISFNYGSNHNEREIPFAKMHCERLGIKHITIDLGFMHQYFKSSLLEGADAIPEGHYAADNMKSTVVPFRNGIMLSIAIGIAESNNLKKVFIANHGGDHTIYPDCRPEFIKAIDEAAEAGTFVDVRVVAPYTNITKGQIAEVRSWALTMLKPGAAIRAERSIVANAEPALSARRLWPRRVLRILPSMKNKDDDEPGVLRSLYIIRCNQNKYNKRK